MSVLTAYPQARALQDAPMLPETVARQLYSMTALASRRARGGTEEGIARLRRAYVEGVAAYREALTRSFWDVAERLAILAGEPASSYRSRERQAYAWGWEDAEHGRFGEAASSEQPTRTYRA